MLKYQTLGVLSLEASIWYFDLNCFKLGQGHIASMLLVGRTIVIKSHLLQFLSVSTLTLLSLSLYTIELNFY